MDSTPRTKKSSYYLVWAGALALYSVLSFFAPVRNNTYNLSDAARYEILLGFIIPIALIWLVAIYGAQRFKQYAASIIDSPDGKALNTVSNGLFVLAFGTILASLISSGKTYLVDDSRYQDYVHLSNTVQWLVTLSAFYLIWKGSAQLLKTVKGARASRLLLSTLLVGYALVSSWYVTAMLHNPYRLTTPDVSKHASYFLHDGSLIALIILPYLAIWLLGIFTIVNILAYRKSVKGTIYRNSLKYLSAGIIGVVSFSIIGQLLGTVGDALSGWDLQGILILVFGIILLYSVGYVLIAIGAKKLSRLEEV